MLHESDLKNISVGESRTFKTDRNWSLLLHRWRQSGHPGLSLFSFFSKITSLNCVAIWQQELLSYENITVCIRNTTFHKAKHKCAEELDTGSTGNAGMWAQGSTTGKQIKLHPCFLHLHLFHASQPLPQRTHGETKYGERKQGNIIIV